MDWNSSRTANRRRTVYLVLLPVVIAVGLIARRFRATADPTTVVGFLATYTGDTLWAVMFLLIARLIWPARPTWQIATSILVFTLTIEFSQLSGTPMIESLRSIPVIRFLLGNTFLWTDVICLLVGAAVGVTLDWAVRKCVKDQHAWMDAQ